MTRVQHLLFQNWPSWIRHGSHSWMHLCEGAEQKHRGKKMPWIPVQSRWIREGIGGMLSPPQGISFFLLLSRLYCYCWALQLICLFPWVGQIFQQMWAMPTITYREGDYRGKNIWEELTKTNKMARQKGERHWELIYLLGKQIKRHSQSLRSANVCLLSFRS